MTLFEGVRAVASASGDSLVDWNAVRDAATAGTPPGDLTLTAAEREAYAGDVRDARERIREVSTLDFDVPDTVSVMNRHHWIDANVDTFERVFRPLNDPTVALPGVSRTLNTGGAAAALSFLARNVLGQYDPLLLGGDDAHELYFVHPNIVDAAASLDVPLARFRRWIAFHEVTHAAEFGAAPWLTDYLEDRLRAGVIELEDEYRLDTDEFEDVMLAMTAVEGYAELLMDRAFDRKYDDLRRKLDARRRGGGPVTKLFRRLLGLGLKRQQYEQGREFFDAIVDARDMETASLVWAAPENLPRSDELETPGRWLARVA
ncbi:zinc-dependent metalloprotease [Salarchaeum japonicum]|uniref:zinc-dependent metalloprotease n=1 Tax=Salarchaeum japonicum TaxID=555573 RepID=UPI003C735178